MLTDRPISKQSVQVAFSDADEDVFYTPVNMRTMKGFGGEIPRMFNSQGTLFPFLENERLSMFIAGPPGCGKSYFVNNIIRSLTRPRVIFLITGLEESDGNFKGIVVHKLKRDPTIIKGVTLTKLRDEAHRLKGPEAHPLVIVDDVDKFRDKSLEKAVYSLIEEIIANGRGHENHDGRDDIDVLVTSHALNEWKKTKYALENSNYIVIFPRFTLRAQIDRLLNKMGVSNKDYEIMRDTDRALIFHKCFPQFVLSNFSVLLLN